MAGEIEAVCNFLPPSAAAHPDEQWQRKKLASIWLGLCGADGAAGPGADRDQVVIAAAHRATIEIEPEPEFCKE